MNWPALLLTAKLATATATLLFVVALPISYWLAFSSARWKFLVQSVVALPLVLPPTVLGFYLLVALGSRSPLGRGFESIFGHSFAFSFAGLLIASVLYSMPFAVQPMTTAFAAIDPDVLAASALLGAGPMRTFLRIILPLSRAGLLTSFVLAFAHTVGEFGVVLMVGGNIPGVTRTISIDIYDRVQEFDYASATHTSLALLLFSAAVLALVYGLNARGTSAAVAR